jgi:vacuolar-type H+-ATPase subunit F/Vma7
MWRQAVDRRQGAVDRQGRQGRQGRRGQHRRGTLAFLATLVLGAQLVGCGPPEAKAPNPTRTLDERRAIDVGVQGHEYGVVYVTEDDAQKLGDAIPPPNRQEEKLRLVRAGADGETRLVLLYQTNYRYDDLVGETHEQTTITAERQLTRDVQDFITHARTRRFR